MQNETCRHSAVILTMMEPQPAHALVRESRLIVQRGMVVLSISTDPSSMLLYRLEATKPKVGTPTPYVRS